MLRKATVMCALEAHVSRITIWLVAGNVQQNLRIQGYYKGERSRDHLLKC